MELSYYKSMEPFWGAWRIKRLIGEGSFGKVFEIEREDFGRTYQAAMKVITIPQSESEFKSTLSDGMDLKSATSYYISFVEEVVDEFAMMSGLKGNSNIVSYEDHTVIEHKDGVGWDILIRMELLTPLLELTSAGQFMERREVIKLGIDICKALEYCQKQNIIHRDIKPENIFVSAAGDYKLGDFGIARTVEKTTSGLSRKGTYTYMAPEVYKGEAYGVTVDIYSLGIVLYRLLNHNRPPFLPEFPAPITHSDRENSIAKRVGGNPIPLPAQAKDTLGEIVLKACAYLPEDRYRSPEEMRRDLESLDVIQSENPMADTNMLDEDVTVSIFGDTEKTESPQNDFRDEDKTQTQTQTQASQDKALPPEEQKSKKNRPLLIGGIGAAAIAVAGIAVFLGKSSGNVPVADEVHSDMAVAVDETDDMPADSGEKEDSIETETETESAEGDGKFADSEVRKELPYGLYAIQDTADILSDMQFEPNPNTIFNKELSVLPVWLELSSANQEFSDMFLSYSDGEEGHFYMDNQENQGKLFVDMVRIESFYEDREKAARFYEENIAGKMDKATFLLVDREGEEYRFPCYYTIMNGKLTIYNPVTDKNGELELISTEYDIFYENDMLQISRNGISANFIRSSTIESSSKDTCLDICQIDVPGYQWDEVVVYFMDGKLANDPVVEFLDENLVTISWKSKQEVDGSGNGNVVAETGEITFYYGSSEFNGNSIAFLLVNDI